jgi:hypothetical protein
VRLVRVTPEKTTTDEIPPGRYWIVLQAGAPT